ncbi:MAG: IS4 family transposase [Mesoflavibacter sp.]|nr:IS4 family transposase [Mesoflavibacter sp.]
MITVDIAVGSGNSSERAAMRKMIVSGSTYIADRGYFSFDQFHNILKVKAHFIIRVKSNLVFTSVESFPVQMPDKVKSLFELVTDEQVCCKNDLHGHLYRLVRFKACGEMFYIMTDRMELTTFQVIMLYSYRWQVELLFRFFKHTMKGLHIIRHTTDGIAIQFYAILITALLMLKLKQDILTQSERLDSANSKKVLNSQQPAAQFSKKSKPYQFFNMIGDKIDKYWKIGIHWLSVLQEILAKPFNDWAFNLLRGLS